MKLSDPEQAPLSQRPTSGAPATSATVGYDDELDEGLHALRDWAKSHDLLSPLYLVIDASGTARIPGYLNTVLRFLAQPIPRALLKEWALERDYLAEIGALTDALTLTPAISNSVVGLPPKTRLRKQMHGGDLTKYFVVALTVRPISEHITDNHRWIETVRTWAITEAIDYVRNDAPIPMALKEVMIKLRLGIDEPILTQDWLQLFCALKAPVSSLYSLRRHLFEESARLQRRIQHEGGQNKHATLLGQLSKLGTAATTSKDAEHTKHHSRLYQTSMAGRVAPTEASQAEEWISWESPEAPGDDDTESGAPASVAIEAGTADRLSAALLDPTLTPAEQARTCQGIQLATLEEHQRLPHSWEKPNPGERARLLEWIATASAGEHSGALGALVYVASQTACSVRRALDTEIATEVGEDWRIDPTKMTLHRRPPRRRAGAQPDKRERTHVRRAADRLVLHPPASVKEALFRMYSSLPTATRLMDWYGDLTLLRRELHTALNSAGLERITPGMTSGWLGQEVFERTLDPVLTQLVTSNAHSGLSGACAYASYGQEIREAACLAGGTDSMSVLPQGDGQQLNCAGSLFDVPDTWLNHCFAGTRELITTLADDPNQWIAHHNALVSYIVGALFAGTGARPVTSPFEAPTDFNLPAGFLYVEDKVTSNLHRGRLLPLPRLLVRLVKEVYLTHLQSLAEIVGPIDASLSREMARLSSLQNSTRLPFFFFLGVNGSTLVHLEVSETTLNASGALRLDLPWNVFRHRQSTYLKRQGVDHEVINGLLGHTENGTSAWGPYSGRTWQRDVDAVRPHLDRSLADLGISMPSLARCTPGAKQLAKLEAPDRPSDQDLYGRQAREEATRKAHDHARRNAKLEIERFVQDHRGESKEPRSLRTLTADELDQLAQQMLYRADNLPHARATLRYEVFTQWLTETWEKDRPRLKKRYLPRLEEASPFSSLAAQAPIILNEARSWFSGPSLKHVKHQVQVRAALAVAICGLIIESRVVNRQVIASLLKNRDYRLVRQDGRYFLEYAQHLDKHPEAPTFRYPITLRTALRFSTARASRHAVNLTLMEVDEAYAPLVHLLELKSSPASYRAMFERLAQLAGQINWQQLPGVVAGYLEGLVVSVGFEHSEWLRLHRGSAHSTPVLSSKPSSESEAKPGESDADEWEVFSDEPDDKANLAQAEFQRGISHLVPPATQSESDATRALATEGSASLSRANTASSTTQRSDASAPAKQPKRKGETPPSAAEGGRSKHELGRDAAQQAAIVLLRRVRTILSEAKAPAPNLRRDLDVSIRQALHDNVRASASCRIFADWIRSLVWSKTRSGRPLTVRSIQRYFFSLSACFEQVAYAHNLALCDEEEVTDFYSNIMDARKYLGGEADRLTGEMTANSVLERPDETADSDAFQERRYKTWQLAFSSLRRFHRFASLHYDVEEPDWSEVGDEEATLSIAPRLLLEKEYLHALRELIRDPSSADISSTTRAFVLILAQRFGLRGNEATGLAQGDWIEGPGEARLVLVRNRPYRKLKTRASRRQVPLLFQLCELEISIIRRHQELLLAAAGAEVDRRDLPMFPHLAGPANATASKAERSAITSLLKRATLNPRTSIHSARHAFANMVSVMLMDIDPQLLGHLFIQPPTAPWVDHVKRTTLGTHTHTRRAPWALARLMGHSHPRTALKSYVHLLPDLAGACLNRPPDDGAQDLRDKRLAQVIDLDQAAPQEGYLQPNEVVDSVATLPAPTAVETLRALRLMQQGISLPRIASACNFTTQQTESLHHLVERIDAILKNFPAINPKRGGTSILLSSVSASRFDNLIESAKHVSFEDAADLVALNSETLLPERLVGHSKQIVLIDPVQFLFLADLLKRWGWPASALTIISSRRIPERHLEWAKAAGFSVTPVEALEVSVRPSKPKAATRKSSRQARAKPGREKQYYQLDWVYTDPRGGRSHDRCVAMPAAPKHPPLTSRAELVVLVAVHLFMCDWAQPRS